jgi:hypothetical protein
VKYLARQDWPVTTEMVAKEIGRLLEYSPNPSIQANGGRFSKGKTNRKTKSVDNKQRKTILFPDF